MFVPIKKYLAKYMFNAVQYVLIYVPKSLQCSDKSGFRTLCQKNNNGMRGVLNEDMQMCEITDKELKA